MKTQKSAHIITAEKVAAGYKPRIEFASSKMEGRYTFDLIKESESEAKKFAMRAYEAFMEYKKINYQDFDDLINTEQHHKEIMFYKNYKED